MSEGPLLAVDFDKTLTDPDQDEWAGAYEQEPNEAVIEATREAYFDGKKVIIWTARQWTEAPQIAGWLTAHEVPYHGLRCGKGGAEEYVDDKAISPKEFAEDDSKPVLGKEITLAVNGEDTVPVTDVQFTASFGSNDESDTPDYMAANGTTNY